MNSHGCLYVVATPIGNLEDVTKRAIRVLGEVDFIAAEDTRHSRKLLNHLSISTPMIAYHEHNEGKATELVIGKLTSGFDVALISDAGTPLLSDPGYLLITRALQAAIRVIPIPGVSALTAALSVAGLPVNRFLFEGFLPATRGARLERLQEVVDETRTMVYFEAPHRILKSLRDMASVLGGSRWVTIGRELTKAFEEIRRDSIDELIAQIERGELLTKGEFVVMVSGVERRESKHDQEHLLRLLLAELPPKRAVDVVHRLTGANKRALYDLALRVGEKKRS